MVRCCQSFVSYHKASKSIGDLSAHTFCWTLYEPGEDRPPAKSFTLIHELVHLLKRESSLCNDMTHMATIAGEEVFCNVVAGELLVPTKVLKIILRDKQFTESYSVSDIQKIANRFSVSREVIIR